MLIIIALIWVILSAGLHIRAHYFGPQYQEYIFKPLTMIFILMIAASGQGPSPLYKCLIMTGLVFSLAGDIFLMLPSDRFIPGLVSFLSAHLFYIAAFVSKTHAPVWWPLFFAVICGIVIYYFLYPFLEKFKWPVLIYMSVILIMAWFAWGWWSQTGHKEALLAAVGAVLFVISDTILAINRFRRPFKLSQALIMITYFAAQVLIAGSITISACIEPVASFF